MENVLDHARIFVANQGRTSPSHFDETGRTGGRLHLIDRFLEPVHPGLFWCHWPVGEPGASRLETGGIRCKPRIGKPQYLSKRGMLGAYLRRKLLPEQLALAERHFAEVIAAWRSKKP